MSKYLTCCCPGGCHEHGTYTGNDSAERCPKCHHPVGGYIEDDEPVPDGTLEVDPVIVELQADIARLLDRIAYLEAGLGALVRHNAGAGACLPDCITNTDDGEDCDCGYMAAEDPGGFAADLLSGVAEVTSERGAIEVKP